MLFIAEQSCMCGSRKPLTIDFVLLLFAGPHGDALDPVAGQHEPRRHAERVPPEVQERRLRVPQALPPLRVAQRGDDRLRREWGRAPARLLGAAKVKCVSGDRDGEGHEEGAGWPEELVLGGAGVELGVASSDGLGGGHGGREEGC